MKRTGGTTGSWTHSINFSHTSHSKSNNPKYRQEGIHYILNIDDMDITICDRFSPSIWVVIDIEMRALSYDVFFESNGIFEATISDLFNCDDFLFQRKGLFLSFFRGCMSIPESCTNVIMLLLSLTCAYAELYETHVSKPIGSIEKQMKLGKIMIQNLEAKRDLLIDDYMVKFTGLTCIHNLSNWNLQAKWIKMFGKKAIYYLFSLRNFFAKTFGSGFTGRKESMSTTS